MKTYSPASALRAFRAMLQGCEHAEVLAEPDVPGAAVIKHHDAYIRATVERETLEDHFLFRFYVTFQLEQETPELEKALNDELGDRLLPLFPDTLRTWGGMSGENPLTLSVGLFAPPALEELEALKAIFDDLVARYPVHYVGNYAKRVEADQAARKEKAEQKDDQPGWILSMYNAIKNTMETTKPSQIAPVILSASRSTDIPAFYAEWFMNRLNAGYALWRNPFNQKTMYVNFERVKAIVFWTKNPAPLIPHLPELDRRGIHYYFQFTLNDYEPEGFEPNVPPLAERIDTFRRLSALLGKERVIWRFDPLILTPRLTPRDLLTRIWRIGNRLKGCTDKLVFSFVDVRAYRKVQQNLLRETACFTPENIASAEPSETQRIALAEGLAKCRDAWHNAGWDLTLATCAEGIDLDKYAIAHNRCIDGDLIERLWHDDRPLVHYLRTGKLPEPTLFDDPVPLLPASKKLKDKGQRPACGCIASKDIGMYNTCPHLCTYCYANSSRAVVLANHARHAPAAPSLIPMETKQKDTEP